MSYDDGLTDVPAQGLSARVTRIIRTLPDTRAVWLRVRAAELADALRASPDPCDQQLLAALDRWSEGDCA